MVREAGLKEYSLFDLEGFRFSDSEAHDLLMKNPEPGLVVRKEKFRFLFRLIFLLPPHGLVLMVLRFPFPSVPC